MFFQLSFNKGIILDLDTDSNNLTKYNYKTLTQDVDTMLFFLLPLFSLSSSTPYGSKAAYSMVAGNLSELTLECPAISLYA